MNEGCDGGWPHFNVFLTENGYMVSEECAPYKLKTKGDHWKILNLLVYNEYKKLFSLKSKWKVMIIFATFSLWRNLMVTLYFVLNENKFYAQKTWITLSLPINRLSYNK